MPRPIDDASDAGAGVLLVEIGAGVATTPPGAGAGAAAVVLGAAAEVVATMPTAVAPDPATAVFSESLYVDDDAAVATDDATADDDVSADAASTENSTLKPVCSNWRRRELVVTKLTLVIWSGEMLAAVAVAATNLVLKSLRAAPSAGAEPWNLTAILSEGTDA